MKKKKKVYIRSFSKKHCLAGNAALIEAATLKEEDGLDRLRLVQGEERVVRDEEFVAFCGKVFNPLLLVSSLSSLIIFRVALIVLCAGVLAEHFLDDGRSLLDEAVHDIVLLSAVVLGEGIKVLVGILLGDEEPKHDENTELLWITRGIRNPCALNLNTGGHGMFLDGETLGEVVSGADEMSTFEVDFIVDSLVLRVEGDAHQAVTNSVDGESDHDDCDDEDHDDGGRDRDENNHITIHLR